MTDEAHVRYLEELAEAAYDKMYDAGSPSRATALYADAKDALRDAIALAHRLGRAEDVMRLEKRLAHIKAVFRSQFT